jgi:putative nucleotidyltransferase with HDIG domain
MFFNLVDGAALHDPGVAAYPIFILFASFFFGKKAIPLSTLLSIGSIALVYLLAEYELINPSNPPTFSRVQILSVLYIVLASLTWALRAIWDSTLDQLKQSYDLTLQGWARALEYRDGETEGHSRRVTALCVELARRLGCKEDEIIHIRRGAYMHDIGKMAIPDRVLFKPGPLDNDERTLMQQHPDIAFNIVSQIPFLQPALAIPYSHHENWDGSGYPQGLKGEQIPLIARMFTIVDHWDALSSDRPYRKAWPTDKIIVHLHENSGKLYDPRIVNAFIGLLDEHELAIKK